MGVATGFTADRMLAIEASSIVSGLVDVNGHLILKKHDDSQVDAGNVVGPPGPVGPITTGIVNMFAGSTAPSGWLLCDGTAISRTTYAALFAIIGTAYGAGDGATTFNVPNLKGRVPVGVDAGQTEFAARGQTGGEKTHLLTATEMPSHTHVQNAHGHTLTDPGHNHTQDPHNHTQNSHNHGQDSHSHSQNAHSHVPSVLDGFQAYRGNAATRNRFASVTVSTGYYAISSQTIGDLDYAGSTNSVAPTINGTTATNQAATASNNATTATNNSSSTGITLANTTPTNQNTGGGGAHNNLQPYIAMNYIIHT